jgi:predicted TIM-barrel fold metal-dependent hydrolase
MQAFSPERLMWASDWPLVLRNTTYERWFEVSASILDRLGHRDTVMGQTAMKFYGISSDRPPGSR